MRVSPTRQAKFVLPVVLAVIPAAYILLPLKSPPPHAEQALAESESPGFVGFEPGGIDLGEQPWYSDVPFQVVFANRLDETLFVEQLGASCGCTVVDANDYLGVSVAPGDTLPISGILKTEGRRGPLVTDVQMSLTNGQVYTAHVHAMIVPSYQLRPTSLSFGNVDLNGEDEHVASAEFVAGTARIMGSPSVDVPWIETIVQDSGDGKTRVLVRLRTAYMACGRQVGRVWIPVSDLNHPAATLEVVAEGSMTLRPVPGHLFLRAGQSQRVRLLSSISDRNQACFPVASADNPDISARFLAEGSIDVGIVTSSTMRHGVVRIVLGDQSTRLLVTRVE